MSEIDAIWEQRDDEPDSWYSKFQFYLLMGVGRSMLGAYKKYITQKGSKKLINFVPDGWDAAARRYDWKARAVAYDKSGEAQARKAYEARRLAILSTGFALEHERVALLDDLAAQLDAYRQIEDRLWITETKQIGFGKDAQMIENVTFNAPLVKELRGTLDDLAKELGQRTKRTEVTGTDGNPIEVVYHTIVKEDDDDFEDMDEGGEQ